MSRAWNARRLACLLLAFVAHSGWTQEAPLAVTPPVPIGPPSRGNSPELQKTDIQTIQDARAGIVQRVIVELQSDDIIERSRQRRAERGLRYEDEVRARETHAELTALVNSVFPQGRLGSAIVVQSLDSFGMAVVQVPDYATLQMLIAHPKVKRIHRNEVQPHALSESLPLVGQPGVIAGGKSGAGYRVAVIDSGLDLRYTAWSVDGKSYCRWDTQGNTSSPYYQPSGPYIGSNGCRISRAMDFSVAVPPTGPWNLSDRSGGHGTNVSGIVVGFAPGAKIDIFQVFDATGTAYQNSILAALKWISDNASLGPGKLVAVNLSFQGNVAYPSSCTDSPYTQAFGRLRDKGILPIVASGNAGFKTGLPEPACAPGAVSVGSVYDSNFSYDLNWSYGSFACRNQSPRADRVVCSSNSSSALTVLAPGAMIFSVGTSGFGGTSQAAPHMSGAVAVLRQAFPADSNDDLLFRITSTGKTITDPTNFLKKPRLNLGAAMATGLASGSSSSPEPSTVVAINSVLNLMLR